ncbi:MAG TPA: hypothetical protein DCP90_00670 [Clostridiales bacterium]|nr:MAG: hypothetical protein A2Y22_08070 [Clostridiales bacterium GWD2_32_59]HAN09110.1 hypothetical protein [Clostridiales bacterium]
MRAIYAFSGDPITYGHIDIIKRSAKLASELVVGIGVNPSKKYLFDLQERLQMAEESLKDIKNVKIVAFEGMLVDYAFENDIQAIIRGVRNTNDFNYEQELYSAGESQKQNIEVLPMFSKPELSHVSSSVVKALQMEQGIIHEYVPLCVKKMLEEKMLGQYIVGVTGTIGTGKSYVSDKLVELGRGNDIPVHNIDLDKIGHQILGTLNEPAYVEIRKSLAAKFGEEILNKDGSVNRKELGAKVFGNKEDMNFLNNLMSTSINTRARREMYGKRGIILINGALLAEAGNLNICNNNVLLISADEDTQIRRLERRQYGEEEINAKIKGQYGTTKKTEVINEIIEKNKYGKLWTLDTTSEKEADIEESFFEIVSGLGYKLPQKLSEKNEVEEILKRLNKTDDTKLAQIIAENIEETYNANKRHYHNLNHILSGLEELKIFEQRLTEEEYLTLQFAYLFHDYIYDTKKKDNEERSADVAKYIAETLGQDEKFIVQTQNLIMSTSHHKPITELEKIIDDVDLSILGKDKNTFKNYDDAIREEYSFVNEEQYMPVRKNVLFGLYNREHIYNTKELREKYELNAKLNLGLKLVEITKECEKTQEYQLA